MKNLITKLQPAHIDALAYFLAYTNFGQTDLSITPDGTITSTRNGGLAATAIGIEHLKPTCRSLWGSLAETDEMYEALDEEAQEFRRDVEKLDVENLCRIWTDLRPLLALHYNLPVNVLITGGRFKKHVFHFTRNDDSTEFTGRPLLEGERLRIAKSPAKVTLTDGTRYTPVQVTEPWVAYLESANPEGKKKWLNHGALGFGQSPAGCWYNTCETVW